MSSNMYVLSKKVELVGLRTIFSSTTGVQRVCLRLVSNLFVYILKMDAVRSYSSDLLCFPVRFEKSLCRSRVRQSKLYVKLVYVLLFFSRKL